MNFPLNWQRRASFTVLDTAFGLGQRFLATWSAWMSDPERAQRLHYVAIAATPAKLGDILSSATDALLAKALAEQWWGLVPGIHRLRFADGRVTLTLGIGALQPMLKSLVFEADAVLLSGDGLETDALDTLKAITRHCQVGTEVLSLDPMPTVRALLPQLGFRVEDGPLALTASFAPHWPLKRVVARAVPPNRATVIGAGLSGATVARQLADRGWHVNVLDRADHPAAGASALPVGLMATHVSPDDAPMSRASRAGIRASLNWLTNLCTAGEDWLATGALEQGRDAGKNSWPAQWNAHDASAWFSRDANGLHHKQAAWVKPGALVRACLDHPHIHLSANADVRSLSHAAGAWTALDAGGQVLSAAPLVVVCNAYGIRQLLPEAETLPLDLVAGQVAMAAQTAALKTPLNGNGHWVPDVPGTEGRFWLSGSTYERMPLSALDASKGLEANRARLARLLAHWPEADQALQTQFQRGEVRRWIGERCTSIDRLPLVGEWLPGLHVSAAQGSRGLCFAALCAEMLVAQLSAEPWPLDAKLGSGFLVKRVRSASD